MKKQIAKKINVLKSVAITGMLSTAVLVSCKKEDIVAIVDPNIVIDFEDITIGSKGYVDSIGANQFDSRNFVFQCVNKGYFEKGFALSTLKDSITPGYVNMYSVYAGSGASNSKTYIIGTDGAKIKLPNEPVKLFSLEITNTTYAALSMRDGDKYGKKFGSDKNAQGEIDGTNGKDFYKVWIKGYNLGKVKDSIEVYLANFQSSNVSEHFIQKSWKKVDLTKLNTSDSLKFVLKSSDTGNEGMNTPSYFAIDNIIFK